MSSALAKLSDQLVWRASFTQSLFRLDLMPETLTDQTPTSSHVVVIGAGWSGWGAAKALCEAGVRVTLVDGWVILQGIRP